jgi:hypothetical protein
MPELKNFNIADEIREHKSVGIEVEVMLEGGEKRWCYFITPSALSSCGDSLPGTEIRFHYGAAHMIVVSELSEDIIKRVLEHIDREGNLRTCTLPF